MTSLPTYGDVTVFLPMRQKSKCYVESPGRFIKLVESTEKELSPPYCWRADAMARALAAVLFFEVFLMMEATHRLLMS